MYNKLKLNPKLLSLFDTCHEEVTKISNENKLKKNKLSFSLLLYILSQTNGGCKTFDDVVAKLKIDKVVNITKGAIMNKRKKLKARYYKNLNDVLVDHIINKLEITNKSHKIVDGTIIYLPKSFTKYGFGLSNNDQSCSALLSVIIDAKTRIPITFNISKDKDERAAFIKQTTYLNPGDTIVFDRGYFSDGGRASARPK